MSITTRRPRVPALKRVYDPAASTDGKRFLVERLWPRGIRKDKLEMEAWMRDVAPSTKLRQWFSHDPAKWTEFQRRYRAELDANAPAWTPLVAAARQGTTTLLFSSRDTAHNNAAVLRDYLAKKLRAR